MWPRKSSDRCRLVTQPNEPIKAQPWPACALKSEMAEDGTGPPTRFHCLDGLFKAGERGFVWISLLARQTARRRPFRHRDQGTAPQPTIRPLGEIRRSWWPFSAPEATFWDEARFTSASRPIADLSPMPVVSPGSPDYHLNIAGREVLAGPPVPRSLP